jgi:hypothetical protein
MQRLNVAKAQLLNLTALNNWQLMIIFGTALSGMASLVNTYDYVSGINNKVQQCNQSADVEALLKTRFIVLLVLSSLAIVLGILFGFIFRNNPKRLVTFGLGAAGVFGILYAIYSWYQYTPIGNATKLGVSWGAFVLFLLLGFLYSQQKITGIKYRPEPSYIQQPPVVQETELPETETQVPE